MDQETIIEKVKKLLSLAAHQSATVGEAATAAGLAQRLIEKYKIDRALLEASQNPKEKERPSERSVWTYKTARIDNWIASLAQTVCQVNGCYAWSKPGFGSVPGKAKAMGAGSKEDLDTVAYMVAYLVNEIERLCVSILAREKREHPSHAFGKTWTNSFRRGAAHEVMARLHEAKKEARWNAAHPEEVRVKDYTKALETAKATGDTSAVLALDAAAVPRCLDNFALVRLNTALARIDEAREDAKAWATEKHSLVSRHRRAARHNSDGYGLGKAAGKGICLSSHKRLT